MQAPHLSVMRSKCTLGATSVAYLGHTISVDGVAMDQDTVDAVVLWPVPC
jgi:hypothetical protein